MSLHQRMLPEAQLFVQNIVQARVDYTQNNVSKPYYFYCTSQQ